VLLFIRQIKLILRRAQSVTGVSLKIICISELIGSYLVQMLGIIMKCKIISFQLCAKSFRISRHKMYVKYNIIFDEIVITNIVRSEFANTVLI
jgi:hypothetical protein